MHLATHRIGTSQYDHHRDGRDGDNTRRHRTHGDTPRVHRRRRSSSNRSNFDHLTKLEVDG